MMVSWTLLPFLTRDRHQQLPPLGTTTTNHQLVTFPNEVLLEVISHLDVISMYRLTRVSASCRDLLLTHHTCWTHIYFDPRVPVSKTDEISRLLGLLLIHGIHKHIHSLRLDGCSVQATTLERLLHHLPSLQHLSIAHCPHLDCFQFLAILERAFFTDHHHYYLGQQRHRQQRQQQQHTAPIMLQHLRRLDMRGLFPSEQQEGGKSGMMKAYAREMYCYSAIKQILVFPSAVPLFFLSQPPLLPAGEDDGDDAHSAHAAALYHQFWLLLHNRNHHHPSTFLFEDASSPAKVRMDVAPCSICRRHIAPNGATTVCTSCGNTTPTPCQQCACHPCGRVLCGPCFGYRQGWQIARCITCRLIRRVCDACHLDNNNASMPWTCRFCCNRRGRKLNDIQDARRNTKHLLSAWMSWPSSFLLPPQHPHQQQPPF